MYNHPPEGGKIHNKMTRMENTEKYRIVDNEGNEVLADVSVSLLEFIEEVKYMMDLYGASRYTQAEQIRDELAEKLDDVMRLSDER
jgi:hypothetical protein